MNRTIPAALALLLGLTLSGCASDGTATEPAAASESAMAKDPSASAMAKDPSASAMAKDPSESAMAEDAAMSKEGAWIDQAAYEADTGEVPRGRRRGPVLQRLLVPARARRPWRAWMPTACRPG